MFSVFFSEFMSNLGEPYLLITTYTTVSPAVAEICHAGRLCGCHRFKFYPGSAVESPKGHAKPPVLDNT